VRGLLELLITIQLLIENAPCRGILQKGNAHIDRVVSQLSPMYICTHCTSNINDNVLPFTSRSSKWSLSLNYLDCSYFNIFFTFCTSSTYCFISWLYLGSPTNYRSVLCIFSSLLLVLLGAPFGILFSDTLTWRRSFGFLLICLRTEQQIN
jgi:hypothetical protein